MLRGSGTLFSLPVAERLLRSSGWLGIGKGTADLIIGYADENIELICEGKFTMDVSHLDHGEGGSADGGWP